MKRQLANILTALRMACSAVMLFFPFPSAGFMLMYLACGLSDMADGFAARRLGTASASGAKLDTAADMVFAAAAAVKILPGLVLPKWLWVWILLIALVKLSSIAVGFLRCGRLVALHTKLNKSTGLMLFLLPLTLGCIDAAHSIAVVCPVATLAAVQEFFAALKLHK